MNDAGRVFDWICGRNPKHQPLNHKQAPMSQISNLKRAYPARRPRLSSFSFGRWSLLGIWSLGFGAYVLLPGCRRDFGTGGTGEMVVPPDRLRQIDPLDLGAYNRPE